MRVLRIASLFLAFASLVLFSHIARAQNPVTWSITANAPASLKAADKFTAQVNAQIQTGWHLYSLTQGAGGPIPTRISLPEGQPFKLAGNATGPRPRVEMDPNFQINTETHEGNISFRVPVLVNAEAPSGTQALNINVRFQACNDKLCLPPRTVKLSAPVMLIEAAAAPTASSSQSPMPQKAKATPGPSPAIVTTASGNTNTALPSISQTPAQAPDTESKPKLPATIATSNQIVFGGAKREYSLWSFIWLAMTFGALSLLTPCVFPMVPITVSYFTNHAAGHRAGAVRDASIYALGIILTFTLLGVSLAIIFGAVGINKFAANPWINLAITAIFVSFAMSLFGAYDLGLPSSVLTRLDSISRGRESSKIIGLLLMGLTFSLTSFTCTAPFVGTLLVMAAQGKWIYPGIGMLAFSTVFALPFFALALAPQLVSQLPRSGGWLNSVKVVMGLLEIAAAMKFLSNVDLVWHWGIFTREVVLASWVAIALLITLYLLGNFQLSHDSPVKHIGALRLMIALVSLALGFYLLTGLYGSRLGELESFLPPALDASSSSVTAVGNNAGVFASNGELTWVTNDYESALTQAKKEKKPVFIDFTGYTCTNCRWMEANMFTKTPVKEELAKYVRVRLYTDGEGQPYEGFQQMQQEKFGTVALPLFAVVNSEGNTLTTFAGLTRNEAEFVAFLKTGQMHNEVSGQSSNFLTR
ncbi:MAG: protein-disulfide reductase DsbD family protein [Pyrinomonadaceae bacterium]